MAGFPGADSYMGPRAATACEAFSAAMSRSSISASGRDRSVRLAIHAVSCAASSPVVTGGGWPAPRTRRMPTPREQHRICRLRGCCAACWVAGVFHAIPCSHRAAAPGVSRIHLIGWAVAAPYLQVAEQVVHRAGVTARFGYRGDVAEPVGGVAGDGRAVSQRDQFGPCGQPRAGPGGEGCGADPGDPVRRVALISPGAHIRRYGTTPDEWVFQTARGGIIQDSAYSAAWAEARKKPSPKRSAGRRSAAAPTTCGTRRCRCG